MIGVGGIATAEDAYEKIKLGTPLRRPSPSPFSSFHLSCLLFFCCRRIVGAIVLVDGLPRARTAGDHQTGARYLLFILALTYLPSNLPYHSPLSLFSCAAGARRVRACQRGGGLGTSTSQSQLIPTLPETSSFTLGLGLVTFKRTFPRNHYHQKVVDYCKLSMTNVINH